MTEARDQFDPPDSPPLEVGLQEAARLVDEERWEEALELLLELEADHPQDATLLCLLGVVSAESSAGGMSYDYFRRSLAAQPQDPAVLVTLGAGLSRFDDPDAEGVLRLAAITAPDLAAARLHYGAYLAREGIFDLALSELGAARELDPEDAQVELQLGAAYLLAGRLEEGLESLEQAVLLSPEEPDVRLLYGLALVRAKQLELGAEEIVRASATLADDGDVQVAAALAAASQGWLDEAWNAVARAESAPHPADSALLHEVEDALEQDPPAAEVLLLEQVLSPLLHERLLERP